VTFLEACRLKPALTMLRFRASEDGSGWIASDGIRCIQAATLEECSARAAKIVNWFTGEFPRADDEMPLTNDR
jgi:hypothetical protein